MRACFGPTPGRRSESARLWVACCRHQRECCTSTFSRIPYHMFCSCLHVAVEDKNHLTDWSLATVMTLCFTRMSYFCFFQVSRGIFQLCLPLSGSGVVQFLFGLHRSSLRPCARSGLESCRALLLIALCSNLLTRPWERLMKSGLKRSRASWGGGQREVYSELLVAGTNTVQLIDTNPVEREINHRWVRILLLNLFLNLVESSSQPCKSYEVEATW